MCMEGGHVRGRETSSVGKCVWREAMLGGERRLVLVNEYGGRPC